MSIEKTGKPDRRITYVIVIAVLFTAICSSFVYFLYNSVNDVNRVWITQNENSLQKVDALTQIYRHLGYGGFIHNFKNYVLRKELK